MFRGVEDGWELIKESIKVFNQHPKFIVPLIFTWLVYAPIILFVKFWLQYQDFSFFETLLIVTGIIFIFTFILSFSCSMLLEMVQQIESGEKMSLTKSFIGTLGNLYKMSPLIIAWTVVWVILLFLQALTSRRRERSQKDEFNAENVAKALSPSGEISWSNLSFSLLQKGIRMVVFLILPSIAWEKLSFEQSVRKGIFAFKNHLSTFATGFTLTWLAAGLIFLPPGIIIYITSELELSLPDPIWITIIIYSAFAWSYSIYLEQMFSAELYLWNLKWEKEAVKAQSEGKTIPYLSDIPMPSVLDEIHEFHALDSYLKEVHKLV